MEYELCIPVDDENELAVGGRRDLVGVSRRLATGQMGPGPSSVIDDAAGWPERAILENWNSADGSTHVVGDE